jgi:hypothetical protein
MKHFQWSLIQLLVGLTFFFSIERIDFEQSNIVDIHSFVYAFCILAVILIILLPQPVRWPVRRLFFAGLIIFIFLKLLVFNQRPFLGGLFTYLTLTEVGFLLLLIFLAHQVASGLREFQEASRYVTLAEAGQHGLNVEDAGPDIRREMTRSRHFHRSLSVIVVEPEKEDIKVVAPRLVVDIQQRMAENCLTSRLAELIGSQTRLVDIVMEDRENGRFIILCPEIDSQGSRLLTDRIQQTLREKLSVNVSFGVASFPQQALTFESLVAEADNHLNHQQHSITNIPVSQEVLRAET